MADMDNKWALNIDKIAYGIAGLVGLIVLCIPLLFSGEDRSGTLSLAVEDLEKKAKAQSGKMEPINPVKVAVIAKEQWSAGAAGTQDPDWVTEREQVLVKKIEKPLDQKAKHEAATLQEISVQRDPVKRVLYLQLKGALNAENDHVVTKKVDVLRKEKDAEGDFAVVGTVSPNPTAEFEYRDEKVVSGKAYSYKIRTTAAADPKAPENVKFDPAGAVKESDPPLETPPVPYEFSLSSLTIDAQQPKLFAKLVYWDYKGSKPVGGVGIKNLTEKDTFADGRYEIFQVPPGEGKVIVQDVATRTKYTFTPADSKNPRPVAPWEPVTAGGAAKEEPEADAAPPEATPKKDTKAAPAAKAAPKAAEKKADTKKPGAKAPPKKGFK